MSPSPVPKERFSQPAAMNEALQKALKGRGDLLASIPTIPAILQTLLAELDQPPENVNLLVVADVIARDESLTAQCLRMANSALFGLGTPTNSIRGAVRTLGIHHTRDIAVSCCIMPMGASLSALDPVIFWQHSLGCAILSRKLARSVGFNSPDQAYLSGLLHDIGYIVNLVIAPQATKFAIEEATRTGVFMGESEYHALGFTHCQSGELLARKWNFTEEIVEVILCHHNAAAAVVNPALVAIISLADKLCRHSSLGLGYTETPDPAISWESDWKILRENCSTTVQMTWNDFVKHSDVYVAEIREMVKTMCHSGGMKGTARH
jgi:putative nucleotidyltransferase with HDIG domain